MAVRALRRRLKWDREEILNWRPESNQWVLEHRAASLRQTKSQSAAVGECQQPPALDWKRNPNFCSSV